MTAPDLPAAPVSRIVPMLVAFVFFIQLLDSTIIATSLPAMGADFGASPVAMGTSVTAYLLAMAILLPAAAWIGDRFGTRRVLIGSIAAFTLASLGCGLAPRLDLFLAARVLQGAAAALMAPVGRMIVLRNTPKPGLMAAIATITWPALFAPVVGPILGAWITETMGWRWNFFINLPLGLAAVLLFAALAPRDAAARVGRFDTGGFLLSAVALLCILGGLEVIAAGGGLAGLAIVAPGLAVAWFAARHFSRHDAPLLDLRVCRTQTFRMATMTAGTLGRISINATPFLLPLLFQVGFGLSPVAAGQLVLVYFLGNLGMKSVTTPILRRFGFRNVLVANGLAAALSIAGLAGLGPDTVPAAAWALLLLAGATRSLQFTALNTLAFADVRPEERGPSSTLSAVTQQVALLLGVALSVVIIGLSGAVRGATETARADLRSAFVIMALVGVTSALAFLSLRPDAGREVSGAAAR